MCINITGRSAVIILWGDFFVYLVKQQRNIGRDQISNKWKHQITHFMMSRIVRGNPK